MVPVAFGLTTRRARTRWTLSGSLLDDRARYGRGVLPVALWITRLQAVALVGLAIAVVVLAATSTTSLPVGFTVTEVVVALLGAVLLGYVSEHPRARTPILLLEIIAVGVAVQLVTNGRPLIAVVVGVPALVAAVAVVLGAREGPSR